MKDKDRLNSGMTRQSFLKATALLPLTAFGTGQATATPHRDLVPGSRVMPRLFKIANDLRLLSSGPHAGLSGTSPAHGNGSRAVRPDPG